ncbi:hypothetical protein UB32_16835 [Mesobacillus subterraneus]|uniref:Uncharacterized protein n=1 Tax=Mesobacillus subterraneus TaxID=285983 RepID=A0A0D6Z8H0_9BACI|nr:hypothetical protein UB32_16835 [Mesobacillus subterraneus]
MEECQFLVLLFLKYHYFEKAVQQPYSRFIKILFEQLMGEKVAINRFIIYNFKIIKYFRRLVEK